MIWHILSILALIISLASFAWLVRDALREFRRGP
jgi:hypothetical protein